jgi:hypothetical protein
MSKTSNSKLTSLSIQELRHQLDERGMDVSGSRLELIDRLEDAPEPMEVQPAPQKVCLYLHMVVQNDDITSTYMNISIHCFKISIIIFPSYLKRKRNLEDSHVEKKSKSDGAAVHAPVLEFNADFGDGFTTLSLPRSRSKSMGSSSDSSSDSDDSSDLETSKPAPMLGHRRFSIVEVVSAVQGGIKKELDEIKEDFDKQDDDEGFQREEEQEVLRLQV